MKCSNGNYNKHYSSYQILGPPPPNLNINVLDWFVNITASILIFCLFFNKPCGLTTHFLMYTVIDNNIIIYINFLFLKRSVIKQISFNNNKKYLKLKVINIFIYLNTSHGYICKLSIITIIFTSNAYIYTCNKITVFVLNIVAQ